MTCSLSRQQRRRMKELAITTDRISQADKRFFERFPHRRHRVRVAHHSEIESQCIVNNVPFQGDTPPLRTFIIVKSLAPHCRFRVGFRGVEGSDTDVGEETCRAIYESIKADNPQTARIEAQMLEALAGGVN
jgi:hypothetical protein